MAPLWVVAVIAPFGGAQAGNPPMLTTRKSHSHHLSHRQEVTLVTLDHLSSALLAHPALLSIPELDDDLWMIQILAQHLADW
jgi:hypothetical protein